MTEVEEIARALWDRESVRVTGRHRNVEWEEAGAQTQAQWLDFAETALKAAAPFIRAAVVGECAAIAKDDLEARVGDKESEKVVLVEPLPMQIDLRDWFAGQVLIGLWAHPTNDGTTQHFAVIAYAQADAMLEERAKP